MQAELMHLEDEYYQLLDEDEKYPDRKYTSRDWWSLTQLDCNGKREQWDILLQIRPKLREYNDELYRQIFLASKPRPNSYDLTFFRDWLKLPRMGNFPLVGLDRDAWSDKYDDDLIALQRRDSGDPLSKWFTDTLVPKFHQVIGHRFTTPLPTTEITLYEDGRLHRFLNILVTVLACLLPLSSIILLYFISSMNARLGVLAGFTALFALCLALVTGAKRVEVFAATSAFFCLFVGDDFGVFI
ncbi:hypothetical protein EG329_009312 [Mollisiaceae sp. DMI_Dod_QoI]|nr:hypothetical protein EG329_009312 [Helotiales sp. DMI_Dod_QoI]